MKMLVCSCTYIGAKENIDDKSEKKHEKQLKTAQKREKSDARKALQRTERVWIIYDTQYICKV